MCLRAVMLVIVLVFSVVFCPTTTAVSTALPYDNAAKAWSNPPVPTDYSTIIASPDGVWTNNTLKIKDTLATSSANVLNGYSTATRMYLGTLSDIKATFSQCKYVTPALTNAAVDLCECAGFVYDPCSGTNCSNRNVLPVSAVSTTNPVFVQPGHCIQTGVTSGFTCSSRTSQDASSGCGAVPVMTTIATTATTATSGSSTNASSDALNISTTTAKVNGTKSSGWRISLLPILPVLAAGLCKAMG